MTRHIKMQLKLSLISWTNQMSHQQWKTFRADLGVFSENIKSSSLRRHEQKQERTNHCETFPPCPNAPESLCSARAELILQKSIVHLSPGPHCPTLTQEQKGYIGASWPTFNREARQIKSQSTPGPCWDGMCHIRKQPAGANGRFLCTRKRWLCTCEHWKQMMAIS